jgi:RNA polymerase primary sigma factor
MSWLDNPNADEVPPLSPLGHQRLTVIAGGKSLGEVVDAVRAIDVDNRPIIYDLFSGVDQSAMLQTYSQAGVLAAVEQLRSGLKSKKPSRPARAVKTGVSSQPPPEARERGVYDPKETEKWFSLINRDTKGDYLSDIDSVGVAELDDEVLALLALYATTRKRLEGLERAVDILNDSLADGNAQAARAHGISSANAGTRRAQAATHIAKQLDMLHGEIEPDAPKARNVRVRTTTTRKQTVRKPSEPSVAEQGYAGDDHLKMHLNAIGKVPLLNAEQEVELAKRIEAGLMAQHLLDSPDSSHESNPNEEELAWLAKDGRDAYEHFITANTRLAVSVARKYTLSTTNGMQLEDRIQAGNESLFRAVQKFDYTKGYKFSTYATWWLRQGIQRAMADEAKTIRIPVHMTELVSKVGRFKRNWLSEHSSEPTNQDIADGLEMKLDDVKKVIDIIRMQPASLNLKLGDDGDTELGDILDVPQAGNDFGTDTTHNLVIKDARELIRSMAFTDKEEAVIERRFALGGGEPETLDMIAEDFGVTRERIRQVESKVRMRIRESPELYELFLAITNDD